MSAIDLLRSAIRIFGKATYPNGWKGMMPSALFLILVTWCAPFPVSAEEGVKPCVDASSEEMRG